MEERKGYEIVEYGERYAPYDKSGRDVVNATWVKLPCKPKGDGLERLLEHKRGLEFFAIWCLLLEKTTLEKPENRGKLLNHRGEPASFEELAKSISLKKKAKLVEAAISALVGLGWIKGDIVSHSKGTSRPLIVIRSDNDNDNDKDKYGEFVFLSKDEHQKLVEKFGITGTKQRIEDLNLGIGSKGYKYKSHYCTILVWDRKNSKAEKSKLCVVDRKLGAKFQLARSGEKVWLCENCFKLLIASKWLGSWADLKKSDLERILEKGKKNLLAQSKPKPKDPELVQQDKKQAAQKLIKETADNLKTI